MTLYRNW